MPFNIILLICLLLAVLGALIIGVISMALGNEWNRKHSTKLMVARITLQAAALILLGLMFLAH